MSVTCSCRFGLMIQSFCHLCLLFCSHATVIWVRGEEGIWGRRTKQFIWLWGNWHVICTHAKIWTQLSFSWQRLQWCDYLTLFFSAVIYSSWLLKDNWGLGLSLVLIGHMLVLLISTASKLQSVFLFFYWKLDHNKCQNRPYTHRSYQHKNN